MQLASASSSVSPIPVGRKREIGKGPAESLKIGGGFYAQILDIEIRQPLSLPT